MKTCVYTKTCVFRVVLFKLQKAGKNLNMYHLRSGQTTEQQRGQSGTTQTYNNMNESRRKKACSESCILYPFIRHSTKSKTEGTQVRFVVARARGWEKEMDYKGMWYFLGWWKYSLLIFGGGYKIMHLYRFRNLYIKKA